MPSINFPNVPIAEGVPNLARSANSLLQTTGSTGRAMGLTGGLAGTFLGQYLNTMLAPTYALLDKDDKKVIVPDGPGEFEMKGDSSVSNYPVEQGGFQSYNKVVNPEDLSLSLLCGGQGAMSRQDFLNVCNDLKSKPVVIKLVTPERVFPYVTCTGMGYKKTARNGATLLTVNMTFKEVRVVATASFPNAKSSSGQVQKNGGQSSAEPVSGDGDGDGDEKSSSPSWIDTLKKGYDQFSEFDNDAQRFFGKLGVG